MDSSGCVCVYVTITIQDFKKSMNLRAGSWWRKMGDVGKIKGKGGNHLTIL